MSCMCSKGHLYVVCIVQVWYMYRLVCVMWSVQYRSVWRMCWCDWCVSGVIYMLSVCYIMYVVWEYGVCQYMLCVCSLMWRMSGMVYVIGKKCVA